MLPTPRDLLKNDSDPVLETIRDMSGAVESVQRRVAQTTSFASEQGINIVAGTGDIFDDSGTDPFTGTAMVYPPYVDASGNEWHFIGVNDGVLQFAVSATDGKAYAGAGGIVIDNTGILLNDDVGSGAIYIRRGGVTIGYIDSTAPSAGLSRLTISQGKVIAGVTGEVLISAITNTSGDGNPNKLLIGATTEINNIKEDIDTKIFGTNTDPIVVVDAGTNSMAVSGGFFGLGAPTTLTLDAAGAITATKSNHYVDTFAAAATDDLVTINGGDEGDILVIGTANSARDITVKDGTGNLRLAGGDFTLNNTDDKLILIKILGSVWVELGRNDNS